MGMLPKCNRTVNVVNSVVQSGLCGFLRPSLEGSACREDKTQHIDSDEYSDSAISQKKLGC